MKREKIILTNEQNKTLDKCFDEFLMYCKVKNLKDTTIKYYTDFINIFFKFTPYKTLSNVITRKTIDNYILFLKEKTNENDTTINSNLNALRSFLRFCQDLDYVEKFDIPKIKCDTPIIIPYTDAELKLLLKKPDLKHATFATYRSFVVESFLMGTGCRCSNVLNLLIQDIDFENNLITFTHTKNRRGQIIPLAKVLKTTLIEYLHFRNAKKETDYVFCSSYGDGLSRSQLEHNLAQYNKKCGVMKTGIHKFRHTFAKKWILNNGDLIRLQKMLGHSTSDMTRKYINMFQTDMEKDFDTFNPLSQLQKTQHHISLKGGRR